MTQPRTRGVPLSPPRPSPRSVPPCSPEPAASATTAEDRRRRCRSCPRRAVFELPAQHQGRQPGPDQRREQRGEEGRRRRGAGVAADRRRRRPLRPGGVPHLGRRGRRQRARLGRRDAQRPGLRGHPGRRLEMRARAPPATRRARRSRSTATSPVSRPPRPPRRGRRAMRHPLARRCRGAVGLTRYLGARGQDRLLVFCDEATETRNPLQALQQGLSPLTGSTS